MRLSVLALSAFGARISSVHASSSTEIEVYPGGLDNDVQRRLTTTTVGPQPVQIYYVPLPADQLLPDTFKKINSDASGNVNTLISIAIAADNTVVWYDHWEDGYEADIMNPTQSTTEVWGDGNKSNKCQPLQSRCTNSNDVLSAGDAIVLQNEVPTTNRASTKILYDGRDKIYVSFPVAVSTGAYPDSPGSLMAGATEIFPIDSWGTSFISPVGQNTAVQKGSDAVYTNAFTSSQLYIMASQTTKVTLPNGSTSTLSEGQSYVYSNALEGAKISADNPVQVHLITGTAGSTYELRWYSLLDVTKWSTDYYSPVGSGSPSDRSSRCWIYNPSSSTITIQWSGYNLSGSFTVAPGKAYISPNIPHGSGSRFTSTTNFIAITQTDASQTGEIYDWGHPLIPANMLTSQALVGWGYGCTNDVCDSHGPRSVVWVMPVSKATIKVDTNNDGIADQVFSNINALQAIEVTDPKDTDMTGAFIYAVDSSGNPVNIAVAWGQDPELSYNNDPMALDLGTVIPPLPIVTAGKVAILFTDNDNDSFISTGDIVQYLIRVTNVGQVNLPANSFNIFDSATPLFSNTAYVTGSTVYSAYEPGQTVASSTSAIPDDASGTPFPLDGLGIHNKYSLSPRGGVHEISFKVMVNKQSGVCSPGVIKNTGKILPSTGTGDSLNNFCADTPFNCSTATTTTSTTTTKPPTTTTTTTTTTKPTTTTTTTTKPTSTTTTTKPTTTTTTKPTTTTTTTTKPTTTTTTTKPTTTTTTTTKPTTTTTTTKPTTTTATTPKPTTSSGASTTIQNRDGSGGTGTSTTKPSTCTNEMCNDLVAGDGCVIGEVCTCFTDSDTLQVNQTVYPSYCCLTEVHICNLPMQSFSLNPCQKSFDFSIKIADVYDFMCTDQNQEVDFVVAGHATIQCSQEIPKDCSFSSSSRRLQGTDDHRQLSGGPSETEYSAYYEFSLHCDMGTTTVVFPA